VNMTDAKTLAIQIAKAVVETVQEAGATGAPSGILYAALMTRGFTIETFERLMALLVRTGLVIRRGDCYFVTATQRR
jgi:hypothetical protein